MALANHASSTSPSFIVNCTSSLIFISYLMKVLMVLIMSDTGQCYQIGYVWIIHRYHITFYRSDFITILEAELNVEKINFPDFLLSSSQIWFCWNCHSSCFNVPLIQSECSYVISFFKISIFYLSLKSCLKFFNFKTNISLPAYTFLAI